MNIEINNIEYNVPTPDNIGSLTFQIKSLEVFKEGTKYPGEKELENLELSEKTISLIKQLSESIVIDLTK